MIKNIQLSVLVIILFSFNSCSDDSITDPSDDLDGATFQFEDGMEWEYEFFTDDEPNGSLFATTKGNGQLLGKESYKYYVGSSKMNIPIFNFTLRSVDSSGYYKTSITGAENFKYLFPELEDQWFKYIDFKNDSWTQFDLKTDTTFKEDRYRGHFKLSGQKVSNLFINYKGKRHYSTIYTVETDMKIILNGFNYYLYNGKIEYTVIENIGIYKRQKYENGDISDSYIKLVDNN